MAAEAIYLTGGEKVGLIHGLTDSSIVQIGDTQLERRIARGPMARRKWTASWVAAKVPSIELLYEVFGTHTAFLLQPARATDYTETNQPLRNTVTLAVTGDGSTATFQLEITRTLGNKSGSKKILHPRTPLTALRVNGVTKTETTHFTVSYTTGIVTFTAGNEPANGHAVVADFLYDTAVRWLSESIETVIDQAYGSNPQQEISRADLTEVFDE